MKRVIKMDKELLKEMLKQRERFIEKFGREPLPKDPVFFDADCDIPTPISEKRIRRELEKAARKNGLNVHRVLKAFGFEDEEGVAKDF